MATYKLYNRTFDVREFDTAALRVDWSNKRGPSTGSVYVAPAKCARKFGDTMACNAEVTQVRQQLEWTSTRRHGEAFYHRHSRCAEGQGARNGCHSERELGFLLLHT